MVGRSWLFIKCGSVGNNKAKWEIKCRHMMGMLRVSFTWLLLFNPTLGTLLIYPVIPVGLCTSFTGFNLLAK